MEEKLIRYNTILTKYNCFGNFFLEKQGNKYLYNEYSMLWILQRKEPWKMKSGIDNLESMVKAWSAAWHANFLNLL